MQNYIIGQIDKNILPMTIGAKGIKRYTNLDYATIFTADLQFEYRFLSHFKAETQIVYNYGKESNKNNLPFISPFEYNFTLSYHQNNFITQLVLKGNAKQNNYARFYGETKTNHYIIFALNVSYLFNFAKNTLQFKAGIENIFDKYYTTFAHWNNIPQAGRNFYFGLEYIFLKNKNSINLN